MTAVELLRFAQWQNLLLSTRPATPSDAHGTGGVVGGKNTHTLHFGSVVDGECAEQLRLVFLLLSAHKEYRDIFVVAISSWVDILSLSCFSCSPCQRTLFGVASNSECVRVPLGISASPSVSIEYPAAPDYRRRVVWESVVYQTCLFRDNSSGSPPSIVGLKQVNTNIKSINFSPILHPQIHRHHL